MDMVRKRRPPEMIIKHRMRWRSNRPEAIFTNCTGGNYSFGSADTASGTFINCTGGSYSFGYNGDVNGGKFYFCSSPTFAIRRENQLISGNSGA
jgi:hypothetical protein